MLFIILHSAATAWNALEEHQRAFLKHWRDLQPLWLCVHDTPMRCYRCSLGQELRVQFSHHSWGANVLHFMTTLFVLQYPGKRKRTLTIKDSCARGQKQEPTRSGEKNTQGKRSFYTHQQEQWTVQGRSGATFVMQHVSTRDTVITSLIMLASQE